MREIIPKTLAENHKLMVTVHEMIFQKEQIYMSKYQGKCFEDQNASLKHGQAACITIRNKYTKYIIFYMHCAIQKITSV